MFPEELPARLIKMFSFAGDTVLDPFLGSGTTSMAARNLGRHSIGYEINQHFIPTIRKKLQIEQADLYGTEYIFLEDNIKSDLNEAIASLPYIFKDPHKLDKKVDPKKLQFGSRIDENSGEREEYYSIKEVISPESDTPRKAGGLMSGAASKAVDPIAKRRAKARLNCQI